MIERQARRLGLIGGMSWESTAQYYRLVNEGVRAARGGAHSADLALVSLDFATVERLQHEGDWDALGIIMADAARQLEGAGARAIVLCTNTMHRVAGAIEAAVSIPLLHIADPVARAARAAEHRRVGLIGTRFTMEQDFLKGRLMGHGIEAIVPNADDRATIHDVIYHELILGKATAASRAAYRGVIARLLTRGAQAIVLGCTEIMLLVDGTDSAMPVYDTTTLHAQAAVAWALQASPG